jgi:hypothetical protein
MLHTPEKLLCSRRSGYLTLEYVEDVVLNYTLAEIPLETVVIDTEAWDNREIFELSQGYPLKQFQAFVDRLHRNGQKWVSMSMSPVQCLNPAAVLQSMACLLCSIPAIRAAQ